jgi:hypothetical protein
MTESGAAEGSVFFGIEEKISRRATQAKKETLAKTVKSEVGGRRLSSTFDFALFFEFGEGLVDVLSGKDLVATSALVGFFGESFINEVVGKIDRVKEH